MHIQARLPCSIRTLEPQQAMPTRFAHSLSTPLRISCKMANDDLMHELYPLRQIHNADMSNHMNHLHTVGSPWGVNEHSLPDRKLEVSLHRCSGIKYVRRPSIPDPSVESKITRCTFINTATIFFVQFCQKALPQAVVCRKNKDNT
jgi:hypothetical protein